MCKLLHEENGLFPMDEEKVRGTLKMAFERRGGTLGIIGKAGRIEAMIFMLFAQMWCTSSWHLEELFNYVRPEYRKSNNAKLLIQFAKQCAEELHLPLIIGVISNTRTEQKIKLYERQFSKPSGAFFTYNTKWQNGSSHAVGQFAGH